MKDIGLMLLSKTIQQGSVYLFIEDSHKDRIPHYFVILNKNPLEDDEFVFVLATSKVEKKRRIRLAMLKLPTTTLVETDGAECAFLTKPTIFDCNELTKFTPSALIDKLQSKLFRHIGHVPEQILTKLIKGVTDSPLIDEELKELI